MQGARHQISFLSCISYKARTFLNAIAFITAHILPGRYRPVWPWVGAPRRRPLIRTRGGLLRIKRGNREGGEPQRKKGKGLPTGFYLGWGLAGPACLTLLYGWVAMRAMGALGYPQKRGTAGWLQLSLPSLLLFVLWGAWGFPLPILYMLALGEKLLRLLQNKENRARELFLIHFTHLASMALHLILIGAASMALSVPMYEILQRPFWRLCTVDIVFVVATALTCLISRWRVPLAVLRTQAQSEEVRPFILFLWFCNFTLLLDSLLCVYPMEWPMLPVFLISSTVLLEFYLLRFLRHLYSILKVHYLEEEHYKLAAELERRSRHAAQLRDKSYTDTLTGIFSRRYIMEQMAFLLQMKEPFSLVFIDLDHLKQINDQQGHHAGDLYLLRFARQFGAQLRKTDLFARIGGDEFAVLLPGCAEPEGKARMEEIRGRLQQPDGPALAFSFGVAWVQGKENTAPEEILRRADQAMYQDKARTRPERGGRDEITG